MCVCVCVRVIVSMFNRNQIELLFVVKAISSRWLMQMIGFEWSSPAHGLSLSLSLSLSLPLSRSRSLSLALSSPRSLPRSLPPSLYPSLSPSLALSLPLSLGEKQRREAEMRSILGNEAHIVELCQGEQLS